MITATSRGASPLPLPRQAFSSSSPTTSSRRPRCSCTEGETMTRYACLPSLCLAWPAGPHQSPAPPDPFLFSLASRGARTPPPVSCPRLAPTAGPSQPATSSPVSSLLLRILLAVTSLKKTRPSILRYSLYVTHAVLSCHTSAEAVRVRQEPPLCCCLLVLLPLPPVTCSLAHVPRIG